MKASRSLAAAAAAVAILLLGNCREDEMRDSDAKALSIVVSDGDVYTAGWISDAMGVPTACYWKNKTRTDVPEYGSAAYSIFVDAGTVHTAGEFWGGFYGYGEGWLPCRWANGARTDLPSRWRYLYGNANAVFVSGGVAYTAGNIIQYGSVSLPHCWAGTSWTELPIAADPCYWAGTDRNGSWCHCLSHHLELFA